ncbi:MAG TPA: carboxypeptidase-like regulatory domain-containing protein [Pirellulales bacterium]|nr:carboxypeptidase-like regulatory domain-containing protein [Pirellulales bacterium]
MIHAGAHQRIVQRALTGILVLGSLLAGYVATTLAKAKASPRVTGQVTDAVTGRRIEKFTVVPVDDFGKQCYAFRPGASECSGGEFTWNFDRNNGGEVVGHRLRVEAEGYRTAMSPALDPNQANVVADFALEPATPTVGRVFGADRKPVPGARVFLATASQPAHFYNEDSRDDEFTLHATTDRFGAFSFPAQFEAYTVIAVHDSGYGEVTQAADSMAGEVILAPWGRIEAHMQYEATAADEAGLRFNSLARALTGSPSISGTPSTSRGPTGSFILSHVPPGRGLLHAMPSKSDARQGVEFIPIEVPAGGQVSHDFGAAARVRGNIGLGEGNIVDVRLEHAHLWLVKKGAVLPPQPGLDPDRFAAADGWRDDWHTSLASWAYFNTLHYFLAQPTDRGAFHIDGVPAGDYTLAIRVFHEREGLPHPRGLPGQPAKTHLVHFTVSEADATERKTIDLGAITVDLVAKPEPPAE